MSHHVPAHDVAMTYMDGGFSTLPPRSDLMCLSLHKLAALAPLRGPNAFSDVVRTLMGAQIPAAGDGCVVEGIARMGLGTALERGRDDRD